MPDDRQNLALSAGFEAPSPEAWEALALKAAGARDIGELASFSDDEIPIEPLYGPASALSPVPVPGMPAAPPTIRPLVGEVTPEAANAAIHEEIAGGAQEILLQIEGPGQAGIRLEAPGDFGRVLDRAVPGSLAVYLRHATAPHDAGAARHAFVDLVDWWSDATDAGMHSGGFGIDTIGAAAAGQIPLSWLESDKLAWEAGAVMQAISDAPGASVLAASGLPYHEAGASQAQELAAMLATGLAYLRACDEYGVPPRNSAPRIELELAADTDLALTIAKLRAARLLWARLGEECGFENRARISVQTSARMMCVSDAETNIVRTTMAALGAGIGGADAITILPFTHAIGRPDAHARRIARNTQHILAEESQIARIADAAAGSWAIESFTQALCATAWRLFGEIETRGGIIKTLASGWLHEQIAAVHAARVKEVAAGKRVLVGATAYRSDQASPFTAEPWAIPATTGGSAPPLRPVRLEDGASP